MESEKQKKSMILKEILFWKSNKLLPEHYCDFLMQLYTEGKTITEQGEEMLASESILARPKTSFAKIIAYVLTTIVILAFVAAMFILSSKLVFIPITVVVLAFTAIMYFVFKTAHNKTLTTTFAFATSALLLFSLSIRLTGIFVPGNSLAIIGVVFMNCVVWILAGRFLHLIYFTISGILGILVIVGYYIFN